MDFIYVICYASCLSLGNRMYVCMCSVVYRGFMAMCVSPMSSIFGKKKTVNREEKRDQGKKNKRRPNLA